MKRAMKSSCLNSSVETTNENNNNNNQERRVVTGTGFLDFW